MRDSLKVKESYNCYLLSDLLYLCHSRSLYGHDIYTLDVFHQEQM